MATRARTLAAIRPEYIHPACGTIAARHGSRAGNGADNH
jgi:hypothetical protein